MAYRLRFDKRFRRHLEALPGDVRGIARKVIHQLSDNPVSVRAKELDDHPGIYRLWLPRNYRLVSIFARNWATGFRPNWSTRKSDAWELQVRKKVTKGISTAWDKGVYLLAIHLLSLSIEEGTVPNAV